MSEQLSNCNDRQRIKNILEYLELLDVLDKEPWREKEFSSRLTGKKLKMSDILCILGEFNIKSSKDYLNLPDNTRYLVDLRIFQYFEHFFRQLEREPLSSSLNLIFDLNDYSFLESNAGFLNQSLLFSNIPLYSVNCEVSTWKFSDEPGYIIQDEGFSNNSKIIDSIMLIKNIVENDLGLIVPKKVKYTFDTTESSPFEIQLNLSDYILTLPFHSLKLLDKKENTMFFNIDVPGLENIPLPTIIAIKKEYSEDFTKFYKALLKFYLQIARAQTQLDVRLITDELNDSVNKFRSMVKKLSKMRTLSTAVFGITVITAIVSMIFGIEQVNLVSNILSGGSLSQVVQSHINLSVESRRNPYWITLFLEKTSQKYS